MSNLSITNKQLASHLAALSELALSSPEAFGNHGDTIIEFVTKKVLQAECPAANVSLDL